MCLLRILSVSLLMLFHISGTVGNTPPIVRMPGTTWTVGEDEEIGTVVVRVHGVDDDINDHLVYSLASPSIGADGSYLFNITQDGIVTIAHTLEGLGGETFYIRVTVSDGVIPSSAEARIIIKKKKGSDSRLPGMGSRTGLGGVLGIGPPPISGKGSLTNALNPFSHINRLPPFMQHSLMPHQIPVFQESRGSPPMLHLPPNTRWSVPPETTLGAPITTVDGEDLAGGTITFSIEPHNLLKINPQTGEVFVAHTLINKTGEHRLMVSARNQYGITSEYVTLVVPNKLPPPTTSPKPTPKTGIKIRPEVTVVVTDLGKLDNQTTYEILDHNSISEVVDKSDEDNHKITMITAIVLLGVLLLIIFPSIFYWRWNKNRLARAAAKQKSSVSFIGKTGSTIISDLSYQDDIGSGSGSADDGGEKDSDDSITGRIMSFWKNGSIGNKYEDGTPPNVPRRKSSSIPRPESDHWEIPRHHLKILNILGEGCFGQVWKAELKMDTGTDFVAVKTLKESAGSQEKRDLLQELKVLKNLGRHPNVVSLIGCCAEKDPVFVVLEYLSGGKLQSYLRASRASHCYGNLHGSSGSLAPKDLIVIAIQVARGMEYLAKNRIVHRDLAARNVLIGENKICKVADFGFARDVANNHIYQRKSDGRLPIRWMAPESLFDNIFTIKSDVWSFGILMWEIVTLGSTPYPGMSAQEVMHKVKDGYRLEKPEHCRRELYNIMYYCWYKDPINRLTYVELVDTLENLLLSEVEYIQLDRFPDHGYYNFSPNIQSGELL